METTGSNDLTSKHGDVHIKSSKKKVVIQAHHDLILGATKGVVAVNNPNGPVSIDAKKITFQGNVYFYDTTTIVSKKPVQIDSPDLVLNHVSLKSMMLQIKALETQMKDQRNTIEVLQSKVTTLQNQAKKPLCLRVIMLSLGG